MVSRMSNLPETPTARKVTTIVAAAGPQGILATDVADHFTSEKGDHHVGAWVNILLSRSQRYGYVRRSLKRELPPGETDRRRRSYRWRITEKGMQYVNLPQEPQVTVRDEPPNTRGVMEILAAAGDEGVIGPVVGRSFTLVYDKDDPVHGYLNDNQLQNLQRRLNWSNQILHRLWSQGNAERGGREASPFYHQVPTYRWFITDKGREFLAGGLAEGRRERREAEKQVKARLRAERARTVARLVTEAYEKYDPERTPACERNQAIRDLRGSGATLDAVAGVFGLTRERVRQIVEGVSVGCRCEKHAKVTSGVGWPA